MVRTTLFLAQEQWKSVPWAGGGLQKNILQYLLDEMVEVPSFLEEVDKYLAREGTTSTAEMSAYGHTLSMWATSLQEKLFRWKCLHADSYPWGQPSVKQQEKSFPVFRHWDSTKNEFTIPTALRYPDLVLATSLCLYNAGQIILAAVELLPSSASRNMAKYTHASDICRSAWYFVQNVTALFIPQVDFLFQAAFDTFDEGSSERAFLVEVCQYINRHRKTEAFYGILKPSANIVS